MYKMTHFGSKLVHCGKESLNKLFIILARHFFPSDFGGPAIISPLTDFAHGGKNVSTRSLLGTSSVCFPDSIG